MRSERKAAALRRMRAGAGLFIFGIVVSTISYNITRASGGGTYLVASGAIFFGVWHVLRGLYAFFI